MNLIQTLRNFFLVTSLLLFPSLLSAVTFSYTADSHVAMSEYDGNWDQIQYGWSSGGTGYTYSYVATFTSVAAGTYSACDTNISRTVMSCHNVTTSTSTLVVSHSWTDVTQPSGSTPYYLEVGFLGTANVPTAGTFTMDVAATPTSLNCGTTNRYVASFTINISSSVQKIYFGNINLNTSTLAGTVKVLFPNAVPDGHGNYTYTQSEIYRLDPKLGTDVIDLCSLYIAATGAGATVTVNYSDYNNTYSTPPSNLLQLSGAGPVSGPCTSLTSCTNEPNLEGSDSTGKWSITQFFVVPGDGEKVQVAYAKSGTGFDRELFPNTGNTVQDGAHSEGYTYSDQMLNEVDAHYLLINPEEGGTVLFGGWKIAGVSGTVTAKTKLSETITVPTTLYQPIAANSLSAGGAATSAVSDIAFSMLPGACGKVDVYFGTLLIKVLIPNCGTPVDGFSDHLHLTGYFNATQFKLKAEAYSSPVLVSATPDVTGGTYWTIAGGQYTWATAHQAVAINVGKATGLIIDTVAGGDGKVYFGYCAMNTSTGSDVGAVLFPASQVYRKEESYSFFDPRNKFGDSSFNTIGDTIDTSNLCVTGDSAGESATVIVVQTNKSTFSTVSLTAGFVSSTNGALPTPLSSAVGTAASVRVQAVPGQYGSTTVGLYPFNIVSQPDPLQNGYLRTLLANLGSYTVSDAHSDVYEQSCAGGSNCIDLTKIYFWQQYGGYTILSAWYTD